ncbi:MAG TPA: hypothetical protein VGO59_00925 [Verrucomicrobiae bacterium]|jgi:hypothetical protein
MVYATGVNVQTGGSSCTGTSFAAPEISRDIDYLWSLNPRLTAAQMLQAFNQAVSSCGSGGIVPSSADGYTTQAFFNCAQQAINTAEYSTLEAGTAGTGTGSVGVSPGGPAYLNGTVVKLTAVPGANSEFAGWGGDAGGSALSTTVTMDGNKSVTAIFNLKSVKGSDYAGTWVGQCNAQYTYQGPAPNYSTEQGSLSFNITMVLLALGPVVDRTQILTVGSVSASSPYFQCDHCDAEFGSAAVLPSPPGASIAGDGVSIIFPNGVDFGTLNDAGDLSISADGSVITGSSDDDNAWDAVNATSGGDFLDNYYFPALGITFYTITSSSWSFTHTSH